MSPCVQCGKNSFGSDICPNCEEAYRRGQIMNYADIERAAKDGTPIKRKEFIECIEANGFVKLGSYDTWRKDIGNCILLECWNFSGDNATHFPTDCWNDDLTVKLEDYNELR